MGIFHALLIFATLLCTLVSGFLFAFAVVVMPGIRNLNDGQFLNAFRVMDSVIQKNQPLFMLAWVGSIIVLIIATVLGMFYIVGALRLLLLLSALIYIFGVQLPTIAFNIPLNNTVQSVDPDTMDHKALNAAREDFEPLWNRWNKIRTVLSILVSLFLLILLLAI